MLSNFHSPGDIAFYLFSMPVYFYGIILAFAVLVGFFVIYYLFNKFYNDSNYIRILENFPYIVLAGILGARLYYCIINYQYYLNHPLEIFYIRQGGLSIHGMIIVGIAVLYYLAKKYKINFFNLTDVFLCACAISQSIGRWGNFFNSEAFGYPTNLPWKLFIPVSHRPMQYINFEFFHPTFLYESVLDFLMFIVLFNMVRKQKKSGIVTSYYLILYAVVRIFVEYFRIDSVMYIKSMPIAQFVSVIMLFIGVLLLYIRKKSPVL